MTRLWDKGQPLDRRVLQYTAGEDYALDERLVRYDIQASIAHAQALNAAGLLSDGDVDAIVGALQALGEEHARGEWQVDHIQPLQVPELQAERCLIWMRRSQGTL